MAREEINFIRPQEAYDVGDNKSKVRYRGYNGKEHELEVAENLGSDVAEIVNDTFVPNESGNVVFTDNNETEHELITEDGFAGALDTAMPTALAKAQVIETTWQELKDKRDNGQLIAGSLYRITDYNCTTTQENTQSAGHQFDIVLLALSEDKLAEEGWAMMNESNIYDVTFSDGVTKKCYMYRFYSVAEQDYTYNIVDVETLLGVQEVIPDIIDDINKTATFNEDLPSTELLTSNLQYNYFQNSNLSAWKVWYCLDNDTSRFAWADDSVDEGSPASITYTIIGKGGVEEIHILIRKSSEDEENLYAWEEEGGSPLYTLSLTPSVGDIIYYSDGDSAEKTVSSYTPPTQGTGLPNGRGVIYRLIDEWMNDVPYDFKNIQFIRPMTDGEYDADNGTDTWCYTFSGLDDSNAIIDKSLTVVLIDCYVGRYRMTVENVGDVLALGENVSFGYSNTKVYGEFPYNNTILFATATLIDCDNLVVENSETNAIYINNKKVLTEE